jgi:hypothetical protein
MPQEVLAPAEHHDQKDTLVPYIRGGRDVGTSWIRGIKADNATALLDLAGQITAEIHPLKDRRISEKQFLVRLRKKNLLEPAMNRLAQIVGYNSDAIIGLYHLWWAYAWTYNYTRLASMIVRDEDDTLNSAAEKMGIEPQEAVRLLARRDIGYLVGIFFERIAREKKGMVMWRVTEGAMCGEVRHAELYLKHFGTEQKGQEQSGALVNLDAMSEHELKAYIAKQKRDVGETPDEEEAEVEIKNGSAR